MTFSVQPAANKRQKRTMTNYYPRATGEVSHKESQHWGTTSPLLAAGAAVVHEPLEMEAAAGEKMRFGCKLKGDFKDVEDKKHRAVYETLTDSDKKQQYFSARQIGCRLLGSL